MSVVIGSSEFRSACFRTIVQLRKPFARAVMT